MNYIDIFLLAVLLLGAIKGYLKGLIVELFSFLGFFFGLFLAIELTIPVADKFFGDAEYLKIITVCVFVGLFILVVMLINLLAKIIKRVLDFTFLGFFDNILGALAGMFKWAFIVSVFFWVFSSIGLKLPEHLSESSLIYPVIVEIGPRIFNWLSEALPFIKEMIDSLKNIHDKNQTLYTFL